MSSEALSGTPTWRTPALLTTTSTSSSSRATSAIRSGSVTSSWMGTTRGSVMVLTLRTAAYTFVAPRSSSACANALPIRRLALVTRAVVSWMFIAISCSWRLDPGSGDPGSIRRWVSRHRADREGGDRDADDACDDVRLRQHQEVRGAFDLRHRGARAVVLKAVQRGTDWEVFGAEYCPGRLGAPSSGRGGFLERLGRDRTLSVWPERRVRVGQVSAENFIEPLPVDPKLRPALS